MQGTVDQDVLEAVEEEGQGGPWIWRDEDDDGTEAIGISHVVDDSGPEKDDKGPYFVLDNPSPGRLARPDHESVNKGKKEPSGDQECQSLSLQ